MVTGDHATGPAVSGFNAKFNAEDALGAHGGRASGATKSLPSPFILRNGMPVSEFMMLVIWREPQKTRTFALGCFYM